MVHSLTDTVKISMYSCIASASIDTVPPTPCLLAMAGDMGHRGALDTPIAALGMGGAQDGVAQDGALPLGGARDPQVEGQLEDLVPPQVGLITSINGRIHLVGGGAMLARVQGDSESHRTTYFVSSSSRDNGDCIVSRG